MAKQIDVHKVFASYFKGAESLAYALSSKLEEGHICVDIKEYMEELPLDLDEQKEKETFREADEIYWPDPEEFAEQCTHGDLVSDSDKDLKPFVVRNGKVYLQRYFRYETRIIDDIERIGKKFHIITGGPGSGKTYSVSEKLIEHLHRGLDCKIGLATPTGKAAVRMKEAIKEFAENPKNKIDPDIRHILTGLSAQTIQRFLGYIKDSVFFRYNKDRKLPYDVVIIDECSMIDGALMSKLLEAIDENTALYLIGDKDQLASIEAGSVFGDLCRSGNSKYLDGKIDTIEGSHRYNEDEGIWKFSREVIGGTFNDVSSFDGDKEIKIDLSYTEELFKSRARKYLKYIKADTVKEALGFLNEIRFLCVTRENEHSVTETNKKIEWFLRKEINDSSVFSPKKGFYHNQPIIVTKNDYTLNVFNGDVGLIRKHGDTLYAHFQKADGEIREIPAGYLNHYDTVFAMTIHKSQGSEFDHVVLLLPEKQGEKLLTRELLYTGVTRAKNSVLLQTTKDVLLKCVEKEVTRSSGLHQRLIAIQ